MRLRFNPVIDFVFGPILHTFHFFFLELELLVNSSLSCTKDIETGPDPVFWVLVVHPACINPLFTRWIIEIFTLVIVDGESCFFLELSESVIKLFFTRVKNSTGRKHVASRSVVFGLRPLLDQKFTLVARWIIHIDKHIACPDPRRFTWEKTALLVASFIVLAVHDQDLLFKAFLLFCSCFERS